MKPPASQLFSLPALAAFCILHSAFCIAQQTETGGAAGFAAAPSAAAQGVRRLDAAWASNNHVKASAYYADYDGDTLENWAEEALGTSPWTNDVAGVSVATAKSLGAFDLVPGAWKAAHGLASPLSWSEDHDNDGWDNWSEWMAGTDPNAATNRPNPTLAVTLDYQAALRGRLVVWCSSRADMDGWPTAVYARDVAIDAPPATVELTDADLVHGHLRQGPCWFFAWMDGGTSVAGLPAWSDGCPAAIADNQLDGIEIGFGRSEAVFRLTDRAESSARVSWAGRSDWGYAAGQGLTVNIYYSGHLVFARFFAWPRTWLHEGDVIAYAVGKYGGAAAHGLGWPRATVTDQIWREFDVSFRQELADPIDWIDDKLVVSNWIHATLPNPVAYWPLSGDTVSVGRPSLTFALDPEYNDVALEIKKLRPGGAWNENPLVVYNATNPAPGRAYNPATGRRDLVSLPLPMCVGDVINGVSYAAGEDLQWVVRGISSGKTSGAAVGYVKSPGMSDGSYRICYAAVRAAANDASANVIRVAAWPDPACAGPPVALRRSAGAPSVSALVYGLPGPGPWFVKARDDVGLGFAAHGKRPVPVYAEPPGAPLSITNRIVIRDCN